MKVLSVASECAPLVKTGGLADVVGALPAALLKHGVEMRTLLPGYPAVVKVGSGSRGKWKVHKRSFALFGGKARILEGCAGGLDLFVLDAPHLFDRGGGPYQDASGRDHEDNAIRFAALSRAGQLIAGSWGADVLHAHDWQAGLAPLYVRETGLACATVMTIHNIAFGGMAPKAMREELELPAAGMNREGFEFWDQISTLKAGMVWADRVTTVSPTYARELRRSEFGFGLDGVVRARGADFSGILNGIDTEAWPGIALADKPAAKAALVKELGLPDTDGPLAVVVTRMTHQKGLDILLDALPAWTDRGGRLALLGSGDPSLENGWRIRAEHPNVSVTIGYDEGLARRMIAGGDLILVPSRFEPCGLTQMYGLRYGTLPLVALTGGLADTVIPTTPAARQAGASTGLQFTPVEADPLAQSLLEALDLWTRPDDWRAMQRNGQRQDVGWSTSAAAYADLYRSIA